MPGVRGFSGLLYLRAQFPGVPVVVVSANEEPDVIRRCMEFGACGFLPKTLGVEIMRTAIHKVLDGGVWTPPDIDLSIDRRQGNTRSGGRLATLTPQQVRVLMMLSEGLLNKQIAFELTVSEATVKAHVSAILQKLGVESRTQAVIAASKIEDRPSGRSRWIESETGELSPPPDASRATAREMRAAPPASPACSRPEYPSARASSRTVGRAVGGNQRGRKSRCRVACAAP